MFGIKLVPDIRLVIAATATFTSEQIAATSHISLFFLFLFFLLFFFGRTTSVTAAATTCKKFEEREGIKVRRTNCTANDLSQSNYSMENPISPTIVIALRK
jgi:hypothetical protein